MIQPPSSPTAAERIDALMELHPKGYDLSLDRISALLEKLGNPQDKLPPVIHVAGTNGKGSTIAFTRAILEAAGLSVHVHTSPHLVQWSERYRLGQAGAPGKLVDDAVLSEAIKRVADANQGNAITVFEILTAVMFVLFSEHPADACIVEVGLGGRFDASNVMNDVDVSVITPVSLDHEAFLGNTLAKIAFEKAGIIKPKTALVVGDQEDEALQVIESVAAKNLAPTAIAQQDFHVEQQNGRFVFSDDDCLLDLSPPALPGLHQFSNAATAIAAAKQFCKINRHELDHKMIDQGLKQTQWPGRLQHLTSGKLIDMLPPETDVWIDGGHNPSAAKAISAMLESMQSRDTRSVIMICGMLNTKDSSRYLAPFEPWLHSMITVPIVTSDAGIEPEELARQAKAVGIAARSSCSLIKAIQSIKHPQPFRLLIAGSLYLVGDTLEQNNTFPN